MSWRRVLGIGALVTAVALTLIGAVVLTMAWNLSQTLDRHFEEALLGPEPQRQRLTLPVHGMALSMAGDWTAEAAPLDPRQVALLGMHALVTIHPRQQGAACDLYIADGVLPSTLGDGEPPNSEALDDAAVRLLGPWVEAQGVFGKAWGQTAGDAWEGKVGFYFGQEQSTTGAVWVVQNADDLYVLACTWSPTTADELRPEVWGDPYTLMLALEPVAESLEFLTEA